MSSPSGRKPEQETAQLPVFTNAVRALCMDAVQQANSGHPGAPMGMAEMAAALFTQHLRHNPADPAWPNRDRFVLSNGHASMLLYAVLHLSGYAVSMDDIKNFRQLHSKTPGHPEWSVTPGVETTTGPLGQGLANAVGMALSETLLAQEFNRPEHEIINHHTYAFVGDGCLMEGISHEVCSLAGTLKLSRLIVLYDDNGISIDGQVQHWFGDDTAARFESYGWRVIREVDGHDLAAVSRAIEDAKTAQGQPTLICCKTEIGKGSPALAGSEKVHGAPLGAAEIAATRQALGWSHPPFEIPDSVYQQWDARENGQRWQAHWQAQFDAYAKEWPQLAAELRRRLAGELPADFAPRMQAHIEQTVQQAANIASRKASQQTIAALAQMLPELLGGSADLTASNLTDWPGAGAVRNDDRSGRHLNYGVREFGMAAIMNGVALHGGFVPFGGTFLTFSDYSRNALRMAALMKQRVIHVFTHDSIGLGEDGPTHQAVEHAASLRLIPNLHVWRPCDAAETAVAWQQAVSRPHNPSALLLSRQNLPFVSTTQTAAFIAKGGYVLRDMDAPRAIIIATGSEVELALKAQDALADKGIAVRVVSMPCTQIFDAQDCAWREQVLPKHLPRVAVEAGATGGWYKYVGLNGSVIGLDTYGESAPAPVLFEHFCLTAEHVAASVERVLSQEESA